jgi:ornithine carbamoyltransferase
MHEAGIEDVAMVLQACFRLFEIRLRFRQQLIRYVEIASVDVANGVGGEPNDLPS